MQKEPSLFVEHFQEEDKKKAEKERQEREKPSAVEAAKRRVLELPADLLHISVFEPLASEIARYALYYKELARRMHACQDQEEKDNLYGDMTRPEDRLETEDLRNLAMIRKKFDELKIIIEREDEENKSRKAYSKIIALRAIQDKIEKEKQIKKLNPVEEKDQDQHPKLF